MFQLTSNGAAVGLTQTGAGAYTAGGNTAQFTTGNGTAVITGVPGGSYQLVEVSAPSAAYTASAASEINLTQNASVTVQNGSLVTAKIVTDEVAPITKLFSKLRDIWGD